MTNSKLLARREGELIALLWRLSTASVLGSDEHPGPVEG
jgi:hypothetical protein